MRDRSRLPLVAIMLLCMAPLLVSLRSADRTEALSVGGEELYRTHCKRCHGLDGTRGFLGAKDLQHSRMEDSTMLRTIAEGNRIMPAFKKKLTPAEIAQVALYARTLRK
jgi:cytochrome c6